MSRWPKELPVLTEDDICKNALSGPDGTRCALGWARHSFGNEQGPDRPELRKFLTALKKQLMAATSCGRLVLGRRSVDGQIAELNDWYVTKEEVAEAWNATLADLGYTELVDV